MSKLDEFYTLKGYQTGSDGDLTAAMEDYLEMICRIVNSDQSVTVGDLSRLLHVRPSSATKMIQQLDAAGYLDAKKYGFIELTEKGRAMGDYLLYRHNVINKFLCTLNGSNSELEQAEKIEHFLSRRTIENLDALTNLLLTQNSEP